MSSFAATNQAKCQFWFRKTTLHQILFMVIGIPKETSTGECRVAATPKTIARFLKQGFEVWIESGAGLLSNYKDDKYTEAGATIIASREELWRGADLVLKVLFPSESEIALYRKGQLGMSIVDPTDNQHGLKKLATQGCSYIAMDAIPRISRAQKMDVLSSMANIAGYRSVIEGTHHFGRFLNGQITAAGKIDPAKVLVIGAGVAGLAAIGAAKNLGAIVIAFDTRAAVAEQIESMGAEFLTVEIEEDGSTASGYSKVMSQAFIDAEMALFRKQAVDVDIVICTALIPGRDAPKLWLADMVQSMKPGSVIVDLAYPRGGNCDLTKPGEIYSTDNGVTIIGTLGQMPSQASQLYSSNLAHLLDDMGKAENFKIDLEDDVIKGSLIINEGQLNWPLPKIAVAAATPKKEEEKVETLAKAKPVKKSGANSTLIGLLAVGALLWLVGMYAPKEFMNHFTVFVLSIFIGWQVIWNVAPALHTPLMSVTNAISGIILLGGILHVGTEFNLNTILAIIAVLVAGINIVGGFLVTHRMLKMFQKDN